MITEAEYIQKSLETNLFFLRIMKEHLIFASAAFTLKDKNFVPALLDMKSKFEELLIKTISLANGVLKPQSLTVGDIITPYTYKAEEVTQYYTGLPIDTDITRMEAALLNNTVFTSNPMLGQSVNILNQQIITLLKKTIQSQKMLLTNVLSCKMFVSIYPLMMDHVTREAEHYLEHLQKLQNHQSLTDGPKSAAMGEFFWNNIMGEHSKFIRGLLDPSEEELIHKADRFADQFKQLTQAAREAYDRIGLLPEVTNKSFTATTNLRDFKEQGTMGILECKIKSIILPLLSDHVLREANHYLKELQQYKMLQ